MADTTRKRRLSRQLDELPGLFDYVDISRDDIAGDIIARAKTQVKADDPDLPELDEKAVTPPPVLKFISFGSGSSGNCAYVGTERGGVLIDAGVDNNYVTSELLRNGIDIESIAGILLTHDHGDHVKFAYALMRRNRRMLLYCTPRAIGGLLRRHNISRRIKDYHKAIYKEFPFTIGDLTVTPFEVSHDGTDNVGFAIEAAGSKFVITTDTGCITERADYYMRQADALMIESNYDETMLRNGTYPEHLKARIASDHGHLDNKVTAAYITDLADRLSHVFLCHLSHDNNTPETALEAVRDAMTAAGRDPESLNVEALPRFGSSRLCIIRPKNP